MRIRRASRIVVVTSLTTSVSAFGPSVSKGRCWSPGRAADRHDPHRGVPARGSSRLFSDISTERLDLNFPAASGERLSDGRSLRPPLSWSSPFAEFSQSSRVEAGSLWDAVQPVVSAALLVTGNTVGASALVLPEVAGRPGMAISSALFLGAYVMNLISGLLIAEVAIKQHETSGSDVPSSFKEFADANLDLPEAGTIISCISLFVNACVMSFDLTRAGQIASGLIGGMLDPIVLSVCVATALVGLVSSQSSKNLSGIASMAVTALFISFGGLLLPGLAGVQDPTGTFFAPGTADDVMTGTSQAAPIILMTMVYQNIVPSVTKILDYDRTKTVVAIALGSFIPMCMYLAWSFAAIGGGIDASISGGGPLLTAFSVAAVTGSTIGATMSLSEEVETFFGTRKTTPTPTIQEPSRETDKGLSLPAVMVSVGMPLSAALLLAGGEDFTAALSVAGGYGSPLLYGAIPAAMAWTQRRRLQGNHEHLVPGGLASLGGLGGGAVLFMGQEFLQDIGHAISSLC